MKVYLDNDYKCHLQNDGTFKEIDVPEFDDKCQAYIEGMRYIPEGESWIRNDGEVFFGKMMAACINSNIIAICQNQYEQTLLEVQTQLEALDILINGEVSE